MSLNSDTVRRQTWHARRFEIFESARHFRIESKRPIRIRIESRSFACHYFHELNVDHRQVPSITPTSTPNFNNFLYSSTEYIPKSNVGLLISPDAPADKFLYGALVPVYGMPTSHYQRTKFELPS